MFKKLLTAPIFCLCALSIVTIASDSSRLFAVDFCIAIALEIASVFIYFNTQILFSVTDHLSLVITRFGNSIDTRREAFAH